MYNHAYPLAFKHRFRRIIAQELERSPEARAYFDRWGNRCYILSDRVPRGLATTRWRRFKTVDLKLDIEALWEMGGRYIISSVPIADDGRGRFRLLNRYHDAESTWRGFFYAGGKSDGIR